MVFKTHQLNNFGLQLQHLTNEMTAGHGPTKMLITKQVVEDNIDSQLAELGGDSYSVNDVDVVVEDVLKAFVLDTVKPVPIASTPAES
jgi:hypothetical protein